MDIEGLCLIACFMLAIATFRFLWDSLWNLNLVIRFWISFLPLIGLSIISDGSINLMTKNYWNGQKIIDNVWVKLVMIQIIVAGFYSFYEWARMIPACPDNRKARRLPGLPLKVAIIFPVAWIVGFIEKHTSISRLTRYGCLPFAAQSQPISEKQHVRRQIKPENINLIDLDNLDTLPTSPRLRDRMKGFNVSVSNSNVRWN